MISVPRHTTEAFALNLTPVILSRYFLPTTIGTKVTLPSRALLLLRTYGQSTILSFVFHFSLKVRISGQCTGKARRKIGRYQRFIPFIHYLEIPISIPIMKNSGLSDSSMRREIMSSLRILTDTYPILRHIHILYSKSINILPRF